MSCSSTSASRQASPRSGLNTSDLAVRYLLVGLVVIMIRGILTEIITTRMLARRTTTAAEVAA